MWINKKYKLFFAVVHCIFKFNFWIKKSRFLAQQFNTLIYLIWTFLFSLFWISRHKVFQFLLTGQPKHNKTCRTYLKILDTLRREIQNNENRNVHYQIFVETFALIKRFCLATKIWEGPFEFSKKEKIVPALVFPIYFSLKYLLVAGVVVVELHWWLSSKKKMGRRKTVKIHKVFIATKLARNEVLLKTENEI